MPIQNTSEIKKKIISFLKAKGPSLPVHIAKEINMSILFASAFLSELVSEREIKISHMKVGGSPVYFIPGQEPMLEKFSQYLKTKEKEAFLLLKQKKFLEDSKQDPAIRVALRALRDFAIPFRRNDKIFWRYLTVPESEFDEKRKIKEPVKKEELIVPPQIKVEKIPVELGKHSIKKEKTLDIFEEKPKKAETKIKTIKRKTPKKKNDKFFNKVKEFLSEKSIEILDIQDFNKTGITLIVKENGEEKLLVAYNKKRISETDLIKTNQKASKLNLKYIILSRGEPLKKTLNFIKAAKNLSNIEKIE